MNKKNEYLKFKKEEFHRDFKKKFLLFHYISNQILNIQSPFQYREVNQATKVEQEYLQQNKIYYVKTLFKSPKAWFLKTNCKMLQVNFFDNACIKFDYRNKVLIFVNKNGFQSFHSIHCESYNEGEIQPY